MELFTSIEKLQDRLDRSRNSGLTIGFVPTMGALHEGHLSLIKEALKENDEVVCSIFVNPEQFNNPEDLKKYPRDKEKDISKLESEGCHILFHPSVEEMYPEPVTESFDFGDLDKVMEGVYRPGHFNGVAVVVKRLFEIVKPKRAYLGLKDYQQMVIIHKLTQVYQIPVEIVPCSIVREENGLAMSSRNELLSLEERKQAAIIYKTLKMVKINSGFSTISEIKAYVNRQFAKVQNMRLEYFEIVDLYSLKSLRTWAESKNIIACIAVYVGNVRLIDNIILFS